MMLKLNKGVLETEKNSKVTIKKLNTDIANPSIPSMKLIAFTIERIMKIVKN